jgi:hypothetical protein
MCAVAKVVGPLDHDVGDISSGTLGPRPTRHQRRWIARWARRRRRPGRTATMLRGAVPSGQHTTHMFE